MSKILNPDYGAAFQWRFYVGLIVLLSLVFYVAIVVAPEIRYKREIQQGEYQYVENLYKANPYVRETIKICLEDSVITLKEFKAIEEKHGKAAKRTLIDRVSEE